MSDSYSSDDEALVRCWQQTNIGRAEPSEFARLTLARLERFDRQIRWRNATEYGAGLVLAAWALYKALHGSTSAWAMVLGVLVMLGYLYRSHRRVQHVDPGMPASAYRSALLGRLDDQMRLLRRVAYWYLLPLFAPACLMILERWWGHPGRALLGLGLMGAAFVSIAWLNRSVGARKLQDIRAGLTAFGDND